MANRSSNRLLLALSLSLALGVILPAQPAPATPDRSRDRIEALIAKHAYRLAREELQSEIPGLLGEDRHRARFYLGYVERRLGEGPKAAEDLGAVPTQSLWYPRAQRELAWELRAENRIDQADAILVHLQEVLTGTERDDLRLELAADWFMRARYNPALDLYRKVAEDSEASDRKEAASYAMGWCYERLGNPARAIYTWKEAIRLYPKSPQATPSRLMLANQYLKLGKPLLASDELGALSKSTADPEIAARAQFLAGEGYSSVSNWKLAGAAYAMVKPGTRWSEPAEYAEAYARWQSGDAKGARPNLERWLARYPKSPTRPAALYVLGRIELELGAPDPARATFEKALETGRNSYAELALFGLAELDYNDSHFQACADHARRLLKDYPDSDQRGPARWLLAESLLALKQYPEAIAVYSDLAKNEADLSFLEGKGDAVTFRLGLAHFRTGDYPAAASFLKSVADSRYGQEALYWLAEATYRSGDYAEALSHYARFLKAYPDADKAAEAAYGEAYAAYQLRKYDLSAKLFKQASEMLKPMALRQDALVRLGTLQLNAHEWSAARTTYETLYSSQLPDKDLPDVLYGLCWSTFRDGNNAEAAKLASTFVERFSDNPKANRARAVLGQAYFRLGQYAQAASALEAILTDAQATPEDRSDAQMRLGAAYYNAGDTDKAIQAYRTVYADEHRSKAEREGVAQPLAQALVKSGELDAARQIALDNATGSIWAGDTLAHVAQGYLGKNRASDAVAALNAIDTPTLEQRHLLSEAYRAAGNPEAALSTLDAIAREPGPHQAEWLEELADRYMDSSDPGRAKDILAELAKVSPNHPAILKGSINLASAYLKAGRDQLALQAYHELAARFAARPEIAMGAQLKIGQLELKRSNYTEAAVAYRSAEHLSAPGSLSAVQARYWLGYTLVSARRYEDAANELSKLKVGPKVGHEWQALVWLKQGEAYEHLRRWKDAAHLYELLCQGKDMPAPEKAEARDRLKWIAENVNRRMP